MKKQKEKIIKEVLIILAIELFFLLNVFLLPINKPSMYDDEVFAVMPAFRILNKIDPAYFSELPYSKPANIRGDTLFYMVNTWTGPVSYLPYIPFIYLLGPNVYSIRITKIFLGGLLIWGIYLLARKLFSRVAAIFSSLLAASFPFHIYLFRQGFMDDGLLALFAVLVIYLTESRDLKHETSKINNYLAAFIIGLGLSTKLNFLWFVFAFLILNLKKIVSGLDMIKIKRYFIYSIFLFLGLLPLVVFNLSGDIKDNTLAYLLNSFPDSAYAGFDNSNIIANFFTRLKHFSLMFTDSFILPLRINYFFLVFFTLSCLYGVWKSFSNKDKKNKKFPTKYLLILILLLIQSCFTVTILRVESIALITPFIFLISGKVLKDIYNKKEILAISLLILMILSNLIVLNENRKEISSVGTRRFGGWIHASDSIEEMVTYLKSRNIESPMDLTPNYVGAIIIYSNFTLKPHFCITKVLPPFDYRPCIDPDKFGYYIAYPENVDIVPIQEVIEYSKEKGFIAEIEKIFYFDNGLPEFYILHVSKEG